MFRKAPVGLDFIPVLGRSLLIIAPSGLSSTLAKSSRSQLQRRGLDVWLPLFVKMAFPFLSQAVAFERPS